MYSLVFHHYPCEKSDCVSKVTLNSTISSVNPDPPVLHQAIRRFSEATARPRYSVMMTMMHSNARHTLFARQWSQRHRDNPMCLLTDDRPLCLEGSHLKKQRRNLELPL